MPAADKALLKRRGLRSAGAAVRGADSERKAAEQAKAAAEAGSKGNYYNSHHAYLGARYIDLAFTRYYQGRFDEDALAEYLNIKPKNLPTFEAKFGGGH
jgi:Zn-dependent peptidase ImmA (M78 family)